MAEPQRPGWYPAPDGSATEQWWNGASWSDSKRGVGGAALPGLPAYRAAPPSSRTGFGSAATAATEPAAVPDPPITGRRPLRQPVELDADHRPRDGPPRHLHLPAARHRRHLARCHGAAPPHDRRHAAHPRDRRHRDAASSRSCGVLFSSSSSSSASPRASRAPDAPARALRVPDRSPGCAARTRSVSCATVNAATSAREISSRTPVLRPTPPRSGPLVSTPAGARGS